MRARILGALFFILAKGISLLSNRSLLSISRFVAWLLSRMDKKRGKDAMANLNFVFGDSISIEEKKRIVSRCYLNLAFNIFDFLRLSVISREELLSGMSIHGEDHIISAIKSGKPIIIATAHYGSWERASLFIGLRYVPLSIVGRRLGDSALDSLVFRTRERFGIELLDKNGAMKGLIKAYKSGRSLGIVVDQNTSDSDGILVDFFGKRARHTPVASIIARRFDAMIVPAFVKSSGDYSRHTIVFKEPIVVAHSDDVERDILDATQKQADATEEIIREKCDDWFWFHRRFKNQYEEIYRHE